MKTEVESFRPMPYMTHISLWRLVHNNWLHKYHTQNI